MRFLVLLLLAACEQQPRDMRTRFHPRSVAEVYAHTFEQLAAATNAELGYDCLAVDPVGGTGSITVDDALLDARMASGPDLHVNGLYFESTNTIVMGTPFGKLPDTPIGTCVAAGTCHVATVWLAHEVGHALGLEHTEGHTGLMRPQGDSECGRNEARCLVDALRAGGLAP